MSANENLEKSIIQLNVTVNIILAACLWHQWPLSQLYTSPVIYWKVHNYYYLSEVTRGHFIRIELHVNTYDYYESNFNTKFNIFYFGHL